MAKTEISKTQGRSDGVEVAVKKEALKDILAHPKELTVISIVLGIIVGVVMTAANVYLGLYAGMTVSASIPAAVIALGLFKGVLRRTNILEANIVQTMASAGESLAAGIIFTLPALVILKIWSNFDFWTTTIIAMAGGVLGVVFMIPLRRALIVEQKGLTYPEGVACAAVLNTGAKKGDMSGVLTVIYGLLIGAVVKTASAGLGLIKGGLEYATQAGGKIWFAGLDASPALLAVGYIIKLEIAVLIFIGGLIGWTVGIPLLSSGSEAGAALDSAWTLWSTQIRYLGVGAMVVAGVWSILSVSRGIGVGLMSLSRRYTSGEETIRTERDMKLLPMLLMMGLAMVAMLAVYNNILEDTTEVLLTTGIMFVAAFLFVAVSSYIVGLVGSSNNPVSGMTISALLGTAILLLYFGYKGDSAILATLGVAAIVCCAACTAGDCSQDLKTGSIVGATPWKQQTAQIIGVLIPAFVIAPILTVLHEAYVIGEGLAAPQAGLFASLAEGFFGENKSIPFNMVSYGAILGVAVIIADLVMKKMGSKFRLHLMPMAVGIYLPVTLSVPIFLGGLIRALVDSRKGVAPEGSDQGILASSGLIAGEAVMGVVIAIFVFSGISLTIEGLNPDLVNFLTIAVFALVMAALYCFAAKRKASHSS